MKNVLVTGAAGFLGSHLVKHHLRLGDRVLGLDDFCSSDRSSAHLKDLLSYETFSFVECDITQKTIESVVRAWNNQHGSPSIIYNFACPASPPRYQDMPVHTMLTCVVGTERVLQLADDYGAIVVHASTSEVYGDPDFSPQWEGYRGSVNSYGPRACYDEGKRAAEALCYDFHHKYDVDARLVRIFNTYGPNMDPYDGRVVSNFIVQALKGQKLTVYGKGEQTRSFCYVDDLIRGITSLAALDHNPGSPINLGNPNEFTILDLATNIAEIIGNKTGLQYELLPQDDPKQRRPDITKARQILKWEPQVQLAEGLQKTIEYFRSVVK